MRAAFASLPRIGRDLLPALLVVLIGTNLLDFATTPAPGARPDTAFAIAAMVRVAGVFWIAYVVQRRLTVPRSGLAIGRGFWRFIALQIAAAAGMLLVRAILLRLVAAGPTLVGEWMGNLGAMALWQLLAIRLLAWNAALASNRGFADLGGVWRAQRGSDAAVAGAFVGIVLPLAAIHLALTLVVVRVPMSPHSHITFAVVDGLVSAVQLALTCAIGAVALRLASRAEPR